MQIERGWLVSFLALILNYLQGSAKPKIGNSASSHPRICAS
jgi:hypothetical protein